MASSLSEEEFHRMQKVRDDADAGKLLRLRDLSEIYKVPAGTTCHLEVDSKNLFYDMRRRVMMNKNNMIKLQLLDLRTSNYELESKCKKQEREIQHLNEKCEQTDKELQKAQKAIQKSKKTKEVEQLLQENDQLQRKLQSQEDEFRLQNETLMHELSTLVATNEELEKKVRGEGEKTETTVSSEADDQIRRLQAKNNALQKNVTATKEAYEKQIANLKEQLSQSTSICDDSGGDLGDSLCQSEEDKDTADTNESVQVEETLNNTTTDSEDLTKQINELNLSLDTELEENRILKDQLSNIEVSYKEKNSLLQEDLDKITEKLKKKQESYNILQKEKEDLFAELNKKTDELQSARDRDQKYYTDQITKLQQEVEKMKTAEEEKMKSSQSTVSGLQNTIATLQQQVDAANIVGNQQIQEQTSKYRKQIEDLQNEVLLLQTTKDDLTVQLQAGKQAGQDTLEQLYEVQKERDIRIQEWQEINTVAEKRKNMLEELANTYQRESGSHHEKLRKMEEEYDTELKVLQEQFDSEKKRSSKFEKVRQLNEDLKRQNQSLDEAKGWLERRLSETQEALTKCKEESSTVIKTMETEHNAALQDTKQECSHEVNLLKEDYEQKLQLKCVKEESLKEEIDKHSKEIIRLKQEIKDGVEEKKIHEKKGMTMLKDLKRQLHQERKRAEKLQDKLQEVLSESRHSKSVDELFTSYDSRNDSLREDRSSVSSWSAGASLAKDFQNMSSGSEIHSPDRALQSPIGEYDQEHSDLLNRVASIQQEKWDLEEKVFHLEESTAAMADDLIKKTKIIEHYVMESRTDIKPHHSPNEDKLSLKKVLDLVNKSDDQGLKEMNRKLQRMLEETLTKNMHLQKDLEMLSQEIVRLGKLQHSNDESGRQEKDQSIGAATVKQEEVTPVTSDHRES